MTQALRCDRCEKFYQEFNHSEKLENYYCLQVSVYSNWLREEEEDICDKCLDELLELFLKRKHKSNT